MNILTGELPTSLVVSGREYPIVSDFRTGILVMEAFEDKDLLPVEQQAIMLSLLYGGDIPENIEEAMQKAVWFLDCGEDKTKGEAVNASPRLYSFSKDSSYIFTAINQTHGVDLEQIEYLHWWKFISFFMDLREDCFFNRLVCLRRAIKTGKASKEERQQYAAIRDIAELDDYTREDEREFEAFFNKINK